MQMAVVEFARNACGMEGANSTEFEGQTRYPVVDLMAEQREVKDLGATMRLGAYPCVLKPESRAARMYGRAEVSERHRHRYEVNNEFREQLEAGGMSCSGTSPDGKLCEIVEVADHPWFLGCQFHPEFKSKPFAPHPLFTGFIRAALSHRRRSSEEVRESRG
jgi:CTP synthase